MGASPSSPRVEKKTGGPRKQRMWKLMLRGKSELIEWMKGWSFVLAWALQNYGTWKKTRLEMWLRVTNDRRIFSYSVVLWGLVIFLTPLLHQISSLTNETQPIRHVFLCLFCGLSICIFLKQPHCFIFPISLQFLNYLEYKYKSLDKSYENNPQERLSLK